MLIDPFAAPEPIAAGASESSAWAVVAGIFEGISEGGKIIMGMILLLGLALFFFGRVGAKKLALLLEEARAAKDEAAKAKVEASAAKTSVTNDHPRHLREDIDENQAAIMRRLDDIANDQREMKADIGGIRSDAREDRRRVNALDERFAKYLDGAE